MEKIQRLHHSVTENGKIQIRMIDEYLDSNGETQAIKYSSPYTPSDTDDLSGWDQKTKDIVGVINGTKVKEDFSVEYKEPKKVGLEEIRTFDRVLQEDGSISVRRITRIYDEGVEVSKKFHRSFVMPGDDFSKSDVITKALASKIHT